MLYTVLFRSPGDRKQIDIMAEQTFAKDRSNFMKAYAQETDKPFGYIVLDNHPRTTNEHQVVANVFEGCYTYPYMTKNSFQTPAPPPTVKQPVQNSYQSPVVKPNVTVSVKRKAKDQTPAAKKQKKPVTSTKKQKKPKPAKKKSVKKQKKPKSKKPTQKKSTRKQPQFTGGQVSPDVSEYYEQESGPEDYESPEEPEDYELPESYLERQAYRMARSQGGFGPNFQYV